MSGTTLYTLTPSALSVILCHVIKRYLLSIQSLCQCTVSGTATYMLTPSAQNSMLYNIQLLLSISSSWDHCTVPPEHFTIIRPLYNSCRAFHHHIALYNCRWAFHHHKTTVQLLLSISTSYFHNTYTICSNHHAMLKTTTTTKNGSYASTVTIPWHN